MGFNVKDWKDYPDTSTPITAAALEDLENRVAAYADGLQTSKAFQVNNVLDYGAKGDGSTNDHDAIQAAIDALPATGNGYTSGGIVFFPAGHRYVISSGLDVDGKDNVTLMGAGTRFGGAQVAAFFSSGDVIKARSSRGFRMTGLGLLATGSGKVINLDKISRTAADGAMTSGSAVLTASASFTARDVGKPIEVANAGSAGGTLSSYIASYSNSSQVTLANTASATVTGKTVSITNHDTFGAVIDNSFIYADTGVDDALISLQNAQTIVVQNTMLIGGLVGVRGITAGGNFSNGVRIRDCLFQNQINYPVHNPFQNWVIDGNIVEPLASGNAAFVYNDASLPAGALCITNNFPEDVLTGTGTWIETSGNGITIEDNFFTTGHTAIKFNGTTTGVKIQGNRFDALDTGINRNSQSVTDAIIAGNAWTTVTTRLSGRTGFAGNSIIADGSTWNVDFAGNPPVARATSGGTQIGVAGAPQDTTLTNGQSFTFDTYSAKMFTIALGGGQAALVFADYHSTTIDFVSNPSSQFEASTTPASGKIGLSKSADSHTITVKASSAGGPFVVQIQTIGPVTAATAPA